MINVLAAGHMSPEAARFLGWAVIVVVLAAAFMFLLRLLGIGQ
jgi:hypothetical protein